MGQRQLPEDFKDFINFLNGNDVTNLSSVGNEAVSNRQKTKALRAVRNNGNRMQSMETATATDFQYPQSTLCQLLTANCLLKLVAFVTGKMCVPSMVPPAAFTQRVDPP